MHLYSLSATHEYKLPSSYYEIREYLYMYIINVCYKTILYNDVKLNISLDCIGSLKWCSRITIGFVIVLTLCTVAFAGLVTAAVIIASNEDSVHVFQEAFVIVSKPQPFWIESVTITSSGPYDSSYYYETDLYYINCDRLVNSHYQYNVSTFGKQPEKANDLTVNIPTAPNEQYAYLVKGSTMAFEIYIWSDYTSVECTSELNIYNNYDEFIEEEGLKAVHTSCLDISKNPYSQPNSITYHVNNDNFYFVTISVPSEASYRVNITIQQVIYSSTEVIYKEKCTITSSVETLTDACKFKILEQSIVTNTDSVCILADTRSLISSSLSSFVKFTVSYDHNIFRNIAYIVLLLPLLIYFLACLLVWLCFKCCVMVYTHCKNRNARHEYPTDI